MYNIFYSYAVYKIHLNTRIVNTANMYFLRCKIRNYFALSGHKKIDPESLRFLTSRVDLITLCIYFVTSLLQQLFS